MRLMSFCYTELNVVEIEAEHQRPLTVARSLFQVSFSSVRAKSPKRTEDWDVASVAAPCGAGRL